jgi:glycosyltransferase involved in cell wall biosynthesis
MHVFYLIDSVALSGGAEQSLAAIAPHLVKRGVQLDIGYLHETPGLQRRLTAAGAEVFCLEGSRRTAVPRVRRSLRSRRPDILHTTLYEADIAGRLAGRLCRVPTVTSLVTVGYGPEQLNDPQLARWKVRASQGLDILTARAAVRFHANARHVAEVMSRRLLIRRTRIEVIPRGRDPDALGERSAPRSERVRALLGVGPGQPLAVIAARHEHQKGIDVLLEALPAVLRQVPELQVLVAGREGNQTAMLRARATRLGVEGKVRFLGPRSDVPDLLAAADVFVAPSRWEGLPGVVIEALALEAPIVASDLAAVHEVVNAGGVDLARLVPPGDADALARAILATLDDPDNSIDVARQGKAHFQAHFSIGRIADQMVDFYERASHA